MGDAARASFSEYVRQFAENSDLLVTVSSAVCDHLTEALPKLVPTEQRSRDIRASRNGAELDKCEGPVRTSIAERFRDRSNPPFIMVSTFDPRKNHHYAIDAFEVLWQRGGNQSLCLIGGVGGNCQDVLDRIASHPEFNHRLFTIHDATDAELAYCYKGCSAVVFPSFVEGFGLPIAEAQLYGNTVFASDIPVHREVGGIGCHYVDLNSVSDLADKIEQWSGSQHLKRSDVSSQRPTSWRESSRILFDHCLSAYQHRTVGPEWSSRAA